jgi:phosphatidylglycerophosphatase A
MRRRVPPHLLRRPLHILALGFGSGLFYPAPGTAGTLVAIPLFLLLRGMPLGYYLLVVVVLFLAGIRICAVAARALELHDHPSIVWDEIVGYLVTMTAAPAGWQWVLAGFVLFRLLDIVKPWPIRLLDKRVGGGLGIMLDDLVAGILALTVMQLIASTLS